MELIMKNFNVMGVHLKIRIHPRAWKNNFAGGEGVGESPKNGGLDNLQI